MSVPSQQTASQIEFPDAMAHMNVQSKSTSSYDTPIPMEKISDDTLDTLNKKTELSVRPQASTQIGTDILLNQNLFISSWKPSTRRN